MGTRYLLDTNIAIYFLNGQLPPGALSFLLPIVQQSCNLSVISKIELLGWQAPNPADEPLIQNFVEAANILPLLDEVVEETIALRKLHKIKLPDAMIAATAITYGMTLISRNDRDFAGIRGLAYLNLFTT